jgi:hypothetical protein
MRPNPQSTRDDRYEDALKYLDKLFKDIPEVSYFSVIDVIGKSYFSKEADGFSGEINFLLLDKYKYADDINGDRKLITLNLKGIEAKKAGGHFKYVAKVERKDAISVLKDYLHITVFTITIISAIVSLILYWQDVKNNQKRIEELEKEFQQLKAQLRQSNNANPPNASLPLLKKKG